jgi:hypothetical protein
MTDEQTPTSGNRWEPTDDDHAAPEAPVASETAAPVPRRPVRSWRERVRPAVAGTMAVAAVVAGLGGFAIGRTTAGHDGRVDQQQVGFAPGGLGGDGYGDGPGFDQHGGPGSPGGGAPGPSGQPVPPGGDGGAHDDQQQT